MSDEPRFEVQRNHHGLARYCVVWKRFNLCRMAFTRRGAERLHNQLEKRHRRG